MSDKLKGSLQRSPQLCYRVHSIVHPIKCFNILCSVFNVAMVSLLTLLYVLRSFHKMFFNILGNCYKMCPIKCFYILCSVSNVAMVSWLTLLYVLRSPHKMFFNILGNCDNILTSLPLCLHVKLSRDALHRCWFNTDANGSLQRSLHKMFLHFMELFLVSLSPMSCLPGLKLSCLPCLTCLVYPVSHVFLF